MIEEIEEILRDLGVAQAASATLEAALPIAEAAEQALKNLQQDSEAS